MRGGDNMTTYIELNLSGQWRVVESFDAPAAKCNALKRAARPPGPCPVCGLRSDQEYLIPFPTGPIPMIWLPGHDTCYPSMPEAWAESYASNHQADCYF